MAEIVSVGDHGGVRKMGFVDKSESTLRRVYVPTIRINGKMMPIGDSSSESKLAEFDCRSKARECGKKVIAEAKAKLEARLKGGVSGD